MKRLLLLMTIIITIAFLCGCSTGKADSGDIDMQDKEAANKVELVTKEQIIEYFELSPSELDGIDMESLIEHYHITLNDIQSYTTKDIRRTFLLLDEEMRTDVGYLFNGGQPAEPITSSQIKNIAFLVGEND